MTDPGLPVELTTFIGRGAELEDLERLVTSSRLVTLTGAGGSGKTRLAVELLEREPVAALGVTWVELAALADPELIPQQVAEAFGVHDELPDRDALLGLVRARGGLLVLDNCEHLVDACAELVQELLRGCPDLRVLATSREALGVKGERAWLVPPLSLPPEAADPDQIEAAEAVRLFVERARDAVPDFELTAANSGAVVEICRRLDGIPLAIELAAARIRVLPPEQIRERLDDAFRLLTTVGRTALPRHRTLRATIDWSHDLLTEPSRVLLRRQAVFRGGFTLEAAEDVCAGDGIEREDVLDLVARLVDRSLLVVREHDGAARYGPLETVRQYALERLAESGEEEAVRGRHAAYVLGRVEQAAGDAITPRRRSAVARLQQEMDNIREALLWTRTHDPRAHLRLAGQMGSVWFSVGHWTEARRWMEDALALPEAAEPGWLRAELLFSVGGIATLQGEVATARPWLEEAVALSDEHGFEDLRSYALNYLGMTYAQEGRPEARDYCARAEAWFREHGDDYGLRLSLLLLALTAQAEGKPEEALRLNEEALAVARRFGQDREISICLQNLAIVHIIQGSVDRAEPLLLEALAAARRDPSLFFIAGAVEVLGEVRLRQGKIAEAGRILGAAEAVRGLIGARQFKITRDRLDPLVAAVRAGRQAGVFDDARAAGRALSLEDTFDEILGPAQTTDGAAPVADARAAGPPADPAAAGGTSGPDEARSAPGPVAADLRIAALGPLEIHRRGEALGQDAWPYAKPKELLVLLAVHPAGRTRDQIGQAMWPGASPSQVKNSFHVTLHHLRRTLGGAEWVVIEGDRYRLSPSVTIDVDADRLEREAREALKDGTADAARLRGLLGLYRGEFLEGEVAGPWVEEHRDRLRRVSVDLGLALGAALEAEEDHAGAAEVYQAIAAREDLNEEAHRRLMLSWSRAGHRTRALRHYDRLVTLLRDELDAEPEPETARVYESLRLAESA